MIGATNPTTGSATIFSFEVCKAVSSNIGVPASLEMRGRQAGDIHIATHHGACRVSCYGVFEGTFPLLLCAPIRIAHAFSAGCRLIESVASLVISFGLADGANSSLKWIGMNARPHGTVTFRRSVVSDFPRRLSTSTRCPSCSDRASSPADIAWIVNDLFQ